MKIVNTYKFGTVIALLFFTGTGWAGPLDTWTLRNPSLTANALHGVAFGNNEIVVVGAGGVTLGSTNGVDWTLSQSATTNALSGIAYGNGQFVAVGDAGTIVTSTDGSNWIPRQSGTQLQLPAIAYGNGQFVAVGFGFDTGGSSPRGIVVTSADGTNWVQQRAWATNGFNGIGYGNGMFVAVGDSGSYQGITTTSSDGVNWVLHESGFRGRGYLDSIAYGNGRFVAVGADCSVGSCVGLVITSVDGVNWARQQETVNPFHAIAYGNGQFVAVGKFGTIMTSADGAVWIQRESGMPPHTVAYPLFAIAYGNDQFVTVGEFGTILTSADGVKWFRAQPKDLLDLSDITYGNGEFVAVGNWYNPSTGGWEGASAISPDGMNWTQTHLGPGTGLNRVTFGNAQFVASSFNVEALEGETNILTSTDGLKWTTRHSGTTNPLGGIAYGNGRFVAMAGRSNVVVSIDGVTWGERPTGAVTPIAGGVPYAIPIITFGNGEFVAVFGSPYGPRGSLASQDGASWVQCQCGAWTLPSAVAYGNGRFVEVGYAHEDFHFIIADSADGLHWIDAEPTTPFGTSLNGVTFGSGLFVAVGGGQWGHDYFVGSWVVQGPVTIVTSADGKKWVQRRSAELGDLRAVAYGNGHFVAVGPGGTIFQSGSIITLALASKQSSERLALSLEGPTGQTYTIQSSRDLISWQNLTNITTTQTTSVILDALPAGSERSFYRAYSQ